MAVTHLVPWPTTPAAVTAATARIKSVTGAGLTDTAAQSMGETAAAMVDRFAPDAPDAVKDQAALRIAGWLHARRPRISAQVGQAIRITGDDRFSTQAFRTDPLWASGARGLLHPWRARRALPIAEAD